MGTMKNSLKVLFIARRFPPSVGGMERYAFDLSTALEQEVDMKKITYGGSNKWLPVILPWFFLKASWVLLRHRDIQVIHTQDAVQAPIGWLLHVIFRKPFLIVAHGLDITFQKAFYQRLILPFVRKADFIVSISSATNDEVIKRGVNAGKTTVITLGTHDDFNGQPRPDRDKLAKFLQTNLKDRTLLLTTGRLVKRKGVAWFIAEALPNIVSMHPEVLYLVVGEGSERTAIEEAVANTGLDGNVQLLGRVSDEVRSLLYQSCDIFVMPNIIVPGDMEGFGIVVHEAATAGLPVVASNLEGIKDALVNGKNGILVETRDLTGFVGKIIELIESPRQRRTFGANARRFTLKMFSWESIAGRFVAVYEELTR
jgi:glycosyltransferase involved in cell wall biosynthesis